MNWFLMMTGDPNKSTKCSVRNNLIQWRSIL